MEEKKRSSFLKNAALAGLLGAGYLCFENNRLEVKHYSLHTERGQGIRILQLSDFHDKVFLGGNERLLKKIFAAEPDLILLTGDTVSTGGKNLKRTCEFLKRLTARYTVCGILGNHEQRGTSERFIESSLKKAGVKILKNQQAQFLIHGNVVSVLGLCEKQAIMRSDYIKAFFNMLEYENHDRELETLEESAGIRILLSHFPENYALTGETAYNRFSFELMMSGHSHGGHIRIPSLGGVFSPGQGFFPKYCKGLYKGRNNALLVSAGIGNDAPIPRINNPPSMAVIDFV